MLFSSERVTHNVRLFEELVAEDFENMIESAVYNAMSKLSKNRYDFNFDR